MPTIADSLQAGADALGANAARYFGAADRLVVRETTMVKASGGTPNPDDPTELVAAAAIGIDLGPLGGTPNALTATIPGGVVFPALRRGMRLNAQVPATNTAAVKLTVLAGVGSAPLMIDLLRRDGTALQPGDLPPSFEFKVDGNGAGRLAGLTANEQTALGNAVAGVAAGSGGTRNRVFDPGFLIQQLNQPDTESAYSGAPNFSPVLTLAAGAPQYASDSCYALRVGAAGAATVQRIAGPSISGGANWQRLTVTAVNAAPAAGDFLGFVIPIEGVDIADLQWGTAAAQPLTVGFDTRFPAGTYSAAIQNGNGAASTRSNPIAFVVAADGATGALKKITFPGDQAGAWSAAKGVRGLSLVITVCAGSGLTGAAGWQAGNVAAAAGQSNGMATNGATFDLAAPRAHVGSTLPAYDPPGYARAYADAQRYVQTLTHFQAISDLSGNTVIAKVKFLVPMCKGPAASMSAPAKLVQPGNTYFTQSNANVSFDRTGDFSEGGQLILQAFSGLPTATGFLSYFDAGQYLRFDARL